MTKTKSKKSYTITETPISGKAYSLYVYGKGDKADIRDSRSLGKGRPANIFNGKLLTEIRRFLTARRVKGEKKAKTVKTETDILTVFLAGEKKTVLLYANGKEVLAGKGQPKKVLDGSKLVKITRYSPEKREKGTAEIETQVGEKHNEYVYSDGAIVSNLNDGILTTGRPKLSLNGATLVKIVRFSPEKISKEEKQTRKEIKHRKLVAALPTRIPTLEELQIGQSVSHFSKVNNDDSFINKIKVVEIKQTAFGPKVFAEFILDGILTIGPVKLESLRV